MDESEPAKQHGLIIELDRMNAQLLDMTLRDILFHYPDGQYRDAAVYLLNSSR